jgi:hypothetical protein
MAVVGTNYNELPGYLCGRECADRIAACVELAESLSGLNIPDDNSVYVSGRKTAPCFRVKLHNLYDGIWGIGDPVIPQKFPRFHCPQPNDAIIATCRE